MNDEYNESESFLGGKGFYIALMLCVSIIAVSAWMLVNNSTEEEAEVLSETTVTPYIDYQVSEWKEREDEQVEVIVPVTPEVTPVVTPAPVESPVEEVSEVVNEETEQVVNLEKLSYIWPVVGEVDIPYSMDALVYHSTMGDWRTHDGVDVLAEEGTYVRACAAGTVAEVYEDRLYGTTVVIEHGAGLVSYYANLQAEPVVKQGDTVLAGDVIGGVGDTALCESAQSPHLHFAMSLNEESVDPSEYLPML